LRELEQYRHQKGKTVQSMSMFCHDDPSLGTSSGLVLKR
jgi:hypothetical protein